MNRSKKAAAVLAVTALLVSTQSYAAQSIAKPGAGAQGSVSSIMPMVEAALAQTKKLLPYLDEYPYKTVTINEGEKNSVHVLLRKYDSEEEEKLLPNVSLRFDKTSWELLGFRVLQESGEIGPPAKQDEAIGKAVAFLKQWYGDDMRGYRYNPSARSWGLVFSKEINGLLYPSKSIGIMVNDKGQIVQGGEISLPDSHFNYPVPAVEQTKFPDPKEAVPKEQVEKLFANFMTLVYDGSQFIYKPMFSGYIDATTGKESAVSQASYQKVGSIVQLKPLGTSFTASTKEAAAAYLKQEHGIEAKPTELREEFSKDKQAKYYFWKEGTDQETMVRVVAATGEVTGYYCDGKQKSGNKQVTREEARKIAIKEIEKYLPTNQSEMIEIINYRNSEVSKGYSFTFAAVHQGIPLLHQRFSVYLSGNGITNIFGISKAEFSAKQVIPNKMITAEQAAEEYLKQYPLELVYFYPKNNQNQAVLVYKQAGWHLPHKIDAVTGKAVNNQGVPQENN